MTTRFKIAASILGIAVLGSTGSAISGEATASAQMRMTETAVAAPEFTGITNWFNSQPLRLSDLRGKVVLVNFWTYGCINCAHTLPHVAQLQQKYKNKGLVVIGVHTPEFAFEKSSSNVEAAIKRNNIEYPVAQDNSSATWNAYNNQYWPSQYIIDQNGKIVFHHDGEGQYGEIDQAIQNLIGAKG